MGIDCNDLHDSLKLHLLVTLMGKSSNKHLFDLKIPLGSLLSGYGVLLILYGLFGDSGLGEKSLGINVNLIWGIVMVAVGGSFLGFHFARGRQTR